MKFAPVLWLIVFFSEQSFAQTPATAYNSRALEVQHEVWEAGGQAFQLREVPADMNNESAVIMAKQIEVVNRMSVIQKLRGNVAVFSYITTVHNRIMINDKAALTAYAVLEYVKQWNQSFYYGFTRLFNKNNSFIGVKIIKPDGKEIIINSGEEVLTENNKKYKEGKLAVSGLEVGDILDYYIRAETTQEGYTSIQGPYVFIMGDEYPLLYYNIKFQLNPSAGVIYISANGAAAFEQSSNENNDIILGLTKTNIPKFKSTYLVSSLRQVPYIKLEYKIVGQYEDIVTDFDRGKVKQGFSIENVMNEYKSIIRTIPGDYSLNPLALTRTYFRNPENMRNVPADSLVKVLYDAWRYNTFYFFPSDNINISHELNDRYARSLYSAVNFSKMLDQLHISNSIYLVASRYSGTWQNTLNLSELSALVKITEPGPSYWLAFDDMVTQFNEIPARLQGEDALLITTGEGTKYFISHDKVPVTSAVENTDAESIIVDFDTANPTIVSVDRTCRKTGYQRHNTQKELLLMQDVEADFASRFSQKTLADRIKADKLLKKKADEFDAFFKEESSNLKTYFTDEIEKHFDTKPASITSHKIIESAALSNGKPFEYKSSFTLDNFVQSGGNNYIFEAGKMIGIIKKVEEKERLRTWDIYRPCPSTYHWNITIHVPPGYRIKGMEAMNKQVSNETGTFSSMATNDGTSVNIQVALQNLHYFEKAENWSKILELSDALYFFSTQKLLLEKTN